MSKHADDLEKDVRDERARVDATIDEIQRRLTPGQMIDEVLRQGRGAGSDFVSNLGRTLAANPIPTALVGVGLLWLLLAPAVQKRSEDERSAPSAGVDTLNRSD